MQWQLNMGDDSLMHFLKVRTCELISFHILSLGVFLLLPLSENMFSLTLLFVFAAAFNFLETQFGQHGKVIVQMVNNCKCYLLFISFSTTQ